MVKAENRRHPKQEKKKSNVKGARPVQKTEKEKKLKPKHLNRKMEKAQTAEGGVNADLIVTLTKEKNSLEAVKSERAAKFRQLCMELVEQAPSLTWDESKFQEMVAAGVNKTKLMEALGLKRNKPEDDGKGKGKGKSKWVGDKGKGKGYKGKGAAAAGKPKYEKKTTK